MYRVRQEELPFVGSSHEFVGTEQGDVGVSVFLFSGQLGKGPGPHRHPYDEIQFVREGRGIGFQYLYLQLPSQSLSARNPESQKTTNGETSEGAAFTNHARSFVSSPNPE